jgi:formylglycine-generating enzyme required for sulfatase activity
MNEVFATYLDFELEIGPGRGREYPVAVTHSPVGEAQGTMRFPYDELALHKRLVVLQNALLVPGGGLHGSLSPEELVVRDFGRDLFDALFTGEVRACYEHSMAQARREDKGMRLKLSFQPSDLAALPWEILYDPRQAEYICMTRNTPLARYLELPRTIPPLNLDLPLRILSVIASPKDLELREVAREMDRLETALHSLQTRGLVELTWLEDRTWRHLQDVMGDTAWHVFHFLSRGGVPGKDRLGDQGFLALTDEEGETHRLSPADLARLLADHPSLRVVLLDARDSDGGGSLRNVFGSTATRMVRGGIPAVLAIPYEITNAAANPLFRAFYEALAVGMPVDVAAAVARKAIGLAVDNTVGWGAPALYMGPPDGLVFDPAGGLGAVEEEVAEEPVPAPVQPETVVAPVLVVEPEPTPAEAVEPEPAPVAPPQEAEELPPAQRPERVIPLRSPQPIEPELVLIPAGEFLMGSDPAKDGRAYDAEQPQHGVYLPEYHIARTPVTNAQYAAFVEATGHKVPKGWVDGKPRDGQEDFPVVYVSWRDAMAYCKWLSEKSGQACRLPSEAEWEKAARGTDGEIYPWGNVWDPVRCNSTESGPDDATAVIAYPKGASPYGILDMAGNVWEWTGSLYRPYPYDPNDGREDPNRLDGERALRGGAYYSSARRVRCAYRDSGDVDDWRGNYGFRVCVPSRAVSPPDST